MTSSSPREKNASRDIQALKSAAAGAGGNAAQNPKDIARDIDSPAILAANQDLWLPDECL